MKPIDAATVAAWSGGTLTSGAHGTIVSSVSTDTRSLPPGALFVALAGERFDAHTLAADAVKAGAAAILASRPVDVPDGFPVILAHDSLAALQQLAASWRRVWAGLITGLTGSNGKTSTKDITSAILSRQFPTAATKGNLNNHIGVPLTILAINPDHAAAVVEMGMNHHGEIAPLAAIAAPQTAIITNIGTAHIEHLGSREGIALEKSALASAIPTDGTVILNASDDFTPFIISRTSARILTAGIGIGDIRIENLTASPEGSRFHLHFPDGQHTPASLALPGRHMAANAALAAAAGWSHGLSADAIADGLANVSLTAGRVQLRSVAGLSFLDDSYNANPDSMVAALETLRGLETKGRRIAVLGRMGELGPHSPEGHRRTGAAALSSGINLLIVVNSGDAHLIADGFLAAGGSPSQVHLVPDAVTCAALLRQSASPDDLILLKGSRSAGMERVLQSLSAP